MGGSGKVYPTLFLGAQYWPCTNGDNQSFPWRRPPARGCFEPRILACEGSRVFESKDDSDDRMAPFAWRYPLHCTGSFSRIDRDGINLRNDEKIGGRDLGAATPADDNVLQSGASEPLLKLLTDARHKEIREKFKQVMVKKKYNSDDVEAGRAYVEAYVPFLTYVERIYEAVNKPSNGHAGDLGKEKTRNES